MPDTNPRVAVVTGGASGMGLSIAQRLATDGAHVSIWDRDDDAGTAAAAELSDTGGVVESRVVDVTDPAAVRAAAEATAAAMGAPTILINNAGKDLFRSFLKTDLEQWEDIMRVNLTGTYHCCQAVLPAMIQAGWGRIVNISSSSAQGGQEYMTAYVAAKAGVIGLTQSLAREFGPKGITVNTIPPEFIDTPMLRAAEAEGKLGGSIADHEARTPVRRVGRPEDIAATCAFLVSDDAGYITGQIIGVNGGRKT